MAHRALVAYRRPSDRFALHRARWPARTVVDPEPLARRATADVVLAALDPTVESLVVVEPDWTARIYLVCPLDFPAGDPDPAALALVRPVAAQPGPAHSDADHTAAAALAALHRWRVEARSSLDAAVAAGRLSPAVARLLYRRGLAHRGRLFRPGDASFLGSD
jgi:hypothetical protein